MSEKSVRIADGQTGLRMAVRDAVETDGVYLRVIERVDFASGKFVTPIGNANRGNSAAITSADTVDLTGLPSDLTSNLLVVGDKSLLCVAAEQTVSGGSVTVTPILYDNESTPGIVGVLSSKIYNQVHAFRRGSSSGNYLLPVQVWDVWGAYKIGLHITIITGTSNGVKLYGWII
jgi:hypothetical protein